MELKKPEAAGLFAVRHAVGAITIIFSLLCGFLAIYRQEPPGVRPSGAPAAEFASGRAMDHIKKIARRPHPIGSDEHAVVRDYILGELTGLGLTPEVQKSSVVGQDGRGSYVAAEVQNVIGRIKGSEGAQTVLLACHYDSEVNSPGASDDGAGIATLLEVIRTLKTGPPLKNDTMFLFTDGEEIGLLGATAFIDEHPCAKDVAVVLNFEARGIGGPSIMFETSDGNGWLVGELARALPHPVANSLTYDLYRLLPNSTDLTIFKNRGLRGLNFAYISGLSSYHTARDSYENIDERSLQSHGTSALALTRHFGNLSVWPARADNAVYFDLFSATLISYSGRLVLPLAALGLLSFAALVIIGLRMKRLTIKGITFGAAGFLLNVIAVGVVMIAVWQTIRMISRNPMGGDYHAALYAIGFLALTVALTGALLIWFRRKTRMENLIVGALFWWVVVMVLFCLGVPGGSYLFTWPLLFMLPALGAVFISRAELRSPKSMMLLAAPMLAGTILIAPLISLLIAGFGMMVGWLVMILVVFLLVLYGAHLDLLTAERRWVLPVVSGLLGLALVIAGLGASKTSVDHPRFDHLFYALDVDTGKAIWGSADRKTDEWTAQFFSSGAERADLAGYFPWLRGTILKGDAPILPLAGPSVIVIDDRTEEGHRALRLRVTSPRQAETIAVYWKRELELNGLAVNGKRVAEESFESAKRSAGYRGVSYFGLPKDGIELKLEIKSAGPVELKIEDRSSSLPATQRRERPDYIVASPLPYSDCTVVTRSMTF
jgi:hypothetical protein